MQMDASTSALSADLGAGLDVIPQDIAENIRQALRGLQFGEITITVRNGNVIQIDRIARCRQFKSNHRA